MRIWFIGKKAGIFLGVIVVLFFALILMGHFNNSSAAMSVTAAAERDLPIYCVEKDENDKRISISFDAAWDNSDSEMISNILVERNIRTTFFVVGDWVDKYPETVKMLSDAGHEVMNHSSKHPHMTQISTEKMKQALPVVRECFHSWRDSLTEGLSEDEISTLERLLTRLAERAEGLQ